MNHQTLLLLLTFLIGAISIITPNAASAADTRVYEMRVYYAAPGKFEEMHKRFRDHTNRLFEKSGITLIGYWVPLDEDKGSTNKLIYILAYPSREAAKTSWSNFVKDPEWQAAYKASEANGTLVSKVESTYMKATDYSPEIKVGKSSEPRIFELRTYKTPEGKLENLNARFRDHTVGLFSKYGMNHVGYWVPLDEKSGSKNTLIYVLSHKDRAAAKASFDAFRKDQAWIDAKTASEKDGSLTLAKDGVQSVFMKATDYSPIQ